MNPTAGILVARRFRLIRELGRGSMGTVWLADHQTLGLRCAVKFSAAGAEGDPDYTARFEREARAVAQLDCPNVVRVLDYDVFEGVPFLAMEWLPGEDLQTRLLREGRLEPRDVHRIVTQVAQGLARAHAAGIIHRDLKPGNVFLANGADGEVAKILDFGLAKVATVDGAQAMTQAGSILGTPVYMSPEQARGLSDIDERADLWSLAVITYECLLGKLPFDGPSLGEVFARVMFEPIPVPSAEGADLPRAFDRWWERAASRDVKARFASAPEMAEALGQALGLDDRHSSKADLASTRTVLPPPERHRSRWPAALAVAAVVFAGVQVLPNVPHLTVPPSVSDPMRSAVHAMAHSVSSLAARAEASTLVPDPAPATLPASSAHSSAEPAPAAPPSAWLAPSPGAIPVPATAPSTSAVAARLSSGRSPPEASTRAEMGLAVLRDHGGTFREPLEGDLSATETECRSGQRRCDGRVLQVCNEARDGWADVIECGPGAVCDATGSGGCKSLGSERPADDPSETPLEAPSR
jgi:serine/threonine protein kinase